MAEIEKNRELYEIRIKKGQEYRATIDPEKVNSSTEFFSSAFQEAKVQLREILLATIQTEVPETKRLSTKKEIELLRKYPNNVIAFCADRGRGKTTAMLSFSNALDALSGPKIDSLQHLRFGAIYRKQMIIFGISDLKFWHLLTRPLWKIASLYYNRLFLRCLKMSV